MIVQCPKGPPSSSTTMGMTFCRFPARLLSGFSLCPTLVSQSCQSRRKRFLFNGAMGEQRGWPLWLRRAQSRRAKLPLRSCGCLGKVKVNVQCKGHWCQGVCSAECCRHWSSFYRIPGQDTSNDEAFAFELVDPAPPARLSISQAHHSPYSGHDRKKVALLCSSTSLITLQMLCLELKLDYADCKP